MTGPAESGPLRGGHELLATCWTSAGDAAPLRNELSPLPVEDRILALSDGGWSGIGLNAADLRAVHETMGFATFGDLVRDAGLRHVEVELLSDWWESGARKHSADEERAMLLEAAATVGALHIKAGPPHGHDESTWPELVVPLRELARVAAGHGVRIALEPLPFSSVRTVPIGSQLVREVAQPNLGLLVDAWHVFRARTGLDELRDALEPGLVFGVELNDADPEVVGTLFEDTIGRRRYPGEGSFDLVRLVRLLAETGFDGPWGVEIISAEHRRRPLVDGLRHAHVTTTSLLERALPVATT